MDDYPFFHELELADQLRVGALAPTEADAGPHSVDGVHRAGD